MLFIIKRCTDLIGSLVKVGHRKQRRVLVLQEVQLTEIPQGGHVDRLDSTLDGLQHLVPFLTIRCPERIDLLGHHLPVCLGINLIMGQGEYQHRLTLLVSIPFQSADSIR